MPKHIDSHVLRLVGMFPFICNWKHSNTIWKVLTELFLYLKQEDISIECQWPAFRQSVLHNEHVWMCRGWGGYCTVRSHLSKFEHVGMRGKGQGPVQGSSTTNRQNDRHIRLNITFATLLACGLNIQNWKASSNYQTLSDYNVKFLNATTIPLYPFQLCYNLSVWNIKHHVNMFPSTKLSQIYW